LEPKGQGDVRCDSGIVEGSEISIYYDPLICKLCTYGETREAARVRMEKALDEYVIKGVTHNIPLLRDVISHPRFQKGKLSTGFLPEEYPNGFKGHQLTDATRLELLSVAAYVFARRDLRNRDWIAGGGSFGMAKPKKSWDLYLVVGNNEPEQAMVTLLPTGSFVITTLGKTLTVSADWPLESDLIHATFEQGDATSTCTVQYLNNLALGFRLQHYGTKVNFVKTFKNSLIFP
jgi:propionyl-CoA carboxylase alpha chain